MHLFTSCVFLVQEASHQLLPLLVKRMELFLAQEIEGLKECKAIRYTNSFFFWDLDVSYWSGFIHIDQHQQDVWDTRVYKFQDLNCHINSLLLNSFQEMCLV
jgi:transposase